MERAQGAGADSGIALRSSAVVDVIVMGTYITRIGECYCPSMHHVSATTAQMEPDPLLRAPQGPYSLWASFCHLG